VNILNLKCTSIIPASTAFTDEQRATIEKYASEHGNAAAVKKFKADFQLNILD